MRTAAGLAPELAAGYFRLSPSFTTYTPHPAAGVIWKLDYSRRLTIEWLWAGGAPGWHRVHGIATFRTFDEAARAAAAAAWAVAKFLKYHPENTDPETLIPLVGNLVNGDDSILAKAGIPPVPPEFYEHRSTRKPRTYAEAKDAALAALARAGWSVKSDLKIPHATSPNGLLRLWFKPQAVYVTLLRSARFEGHHIRDARSISYGLASAAGHGLPDMRSMTGTEFVQKIGELYPNTMKVPRENPERDKGSVWRVWITGYPNSYVDVEAISADDALVKGAATQKAQHHGEIVEVNLRGPDGITHSYFARIRPGGRFVRVS